MRLPLIYSTSFSLSVYALIPSRDGLCSESGFLSSLRNSATLLNSPSHVPSPKESE